MTREQIRQTIERLEQMHAEESCLPLLAQAAARDALTLLRDLAISFDDNLFAEVVGVFADLDRERKAVKS